MFKISEYSFCKKSGRQLLGSGPLLQLFEADGSSPNNTKFKAEWIYKSTPSYTFTECEGKTVLYTSVNFGLSRTGFFIFFYPSTVHFCIT
jgi:hypothetical protein